MKPTPEFIEGLSILEPFLLNYDFRLENIKTQQSSGGQFSDAAYINGKKKFLIGYRYSIGRLDYQFEEHIVMHTFYMDGLGYADKKLFPDFQKDNGLNSFQHILADFEYLKDDFFTGQCLRLKEIADFQKKYYSDLQAKLYAEDELKNNKQIIDKARKEFKLKNYKGCIDIYKTISKNYVLTEFDKRTIYLCQQHL